MLPQFVACFALAALFNNSLNMTGWLASRSELVMTFGSPWKVGGGQPQAKISDLHGLSVRGLKAILSSH